MAKKNIKKIKALTPSDRANSLRAFFLFGRKYPHFWGFMQANVSIPDMFESVNVFSDILDFSDQEKVKDWINMALSDFSAARKLYKAEDGLALYHLQQGIEKLFKATLIFTGFRTEATVVSLNHRPHEFVFDLLEDPKVMNVLDQNYPFKRLKRPKIKDQSIVELKKGLLSTNKEMAMEKGDNVVKVVTNILGKPNPIIFDPNSIGDVSLKAINEIIPKKELNKFKKEIIIKNAPFEDVVYGISNDFFILVNMTLILLPLSVGAWTFGSVPRYPDEMRLLKRDIREYELHKAFYTVLNHVEKFGEFFYNYVQ
jgi:hypothetical protein